MKSYFNLRYLALILFLITINLSAQEDFNLLPSLKNIPGLKIKEMDTDTIYSQKYEVFLEQPLDYKNPGLGTFQQRFFICHRGIDKPVVFVTEGYGAGYAENPRYRSELATLLDANEIVVEHRYCSESSPKKPDWQYLTVENAANDHHQIIKLMKTIYQGKWVSTGISKGGQTALFHRTFFPADVDATVGYVCPLNFSSEDLRVYDFLDDVGTEECRKRIQEYQLLMLKNREQYLPEFEKIAKKKNLTFSIGVGAAYELTVMEYEFAFWQWGTNCNQVPDASASMTRCLDQLDKVASFDWASDQGVEKFQPFFYQAMTEIGMYGYDLEPFKDQLKYLNDNTFSFTCPDDYICEFNAETMIRVDNFVRHEAQNMIFIYGEWDPWSSTAVQWSGNPAVLVVYKPQGSHNTRIYNLPEKEKNQVLDKLEEWLGVTITD